MEIFKCPVYINADMPEINLDKPLYIDCETDEQDNFVGIGYTQNGRDYYYHSVLTDELKDLLGKVYLIGHNLKGDAHWLKNWGVDIKSDHLLEDTMLMSYVYYGASRSHGLKSLALDLLGMKWSTYEEMTTKEIESVHYNKYETWVAENGKRKRCKLKEPKKVVTVKKVNVTLDKLPVEDVAKYCCSDVCATYQLFQKFDNDMLNHDKDLYRNVELPTMKVIFDMENRGIKLDVDKLHHLDMQVQLRLQEIMNQCKQYAGDINIGSSKQLAPVLEKMGFWLPTTKKGNKSVKKSVLEIHKGHPFIDLLLEHSMLKKVYTSFTQPLSKLTTLPRVYPTFNQVRSDKEDDKLGISTGRLSCAHPNLQQIPSRSVIAKKIRQLFIPDDDQVLVVADLSQIEPRIMSHIAKETYLQDVFKQGKDMYLALIKGTSWENKPNGRYIGKTFYLALSYGAQAKKLAKIFGCPLNEAQVLMDQCWANIPKIKQWQQRMIETTRKTEVVYTLDRRKRYLPEINSDEFYLRASAERKAYNTPIQGTAADIMKKIMIALHKNGYPIQLVVHDEIVMSVDKKDIDLVLDDVKRIMENTVKLDVPIKVEVGYGENWDEAKK